VVRVQGKFSIHDACDAAGSVCCTLASVWGARHQSWNLTDASGWAFSHSEITTVAGVLPPCPLTIRIRLKPER